jgi:hypothetical protein
MKQKGKILLLLLLFTMLFLTSPSAIAPDDLVYSQYFDSADVGSWYGTNEWNSSWNFADGQLHGNGMLPEWDDFLLTGPIFNLHEYTVLFDVHLDLNRAHGADQFHFIFNYNTGYAVMELGTETHACHYIDSAYYWSYLNYSFPTNQWMTVQIAAKDGKLDLWIDDKYIHSESPMNAPVLEQIGFGLYSYSNAHFDDFEVYSSYRTPDGPHGGFKPEDFEIKQEDSFTYRMTSYSGSESEANLTGWFRDANTDHSMLFYLSQGEEFEMFVFEIWESGVVVDIYKNDEYEGHVISNFFFLPIYSDLTNFKMFEGTSLSENDDQYFVLANEGDIKSTTPCTLEFYWDKSNGVLTDLKVTFGVITFEDGSFISGFHLELVDSTLDSGNDYGVGKDDTFIYHLTDYVGSELEINLNGWFRDEDSGIAMNLSLAQSDELKIIIIEFIEYGVMVEVHKNNNYLGDGIASFFFLPVNGNMSSFTMFGEAPLTDVGEFYVGTLPSNYTGSSTEVTIEFAWYKDSGILYKIELMSGIMTMSDGSTISSFKFELIDFTTTPKDTHTDPILTPGWELIPSLACLLAVPIVLRKKRKS